MMTGPSIPRKLLPVTQKDRKFLRWAVDGARLFPTCGKGQYLAIVTSPHGRVIGTGYNGSAPGTLHCVDGGCPRYQASLRGEPVSDDYSDCVSLHAEHNALLYSDPAQRRGGTLYVNGLPCWLCAKLLAGSGLARVIALGEERFNTGPIRELLWNAEVQYEVLTLDDLP